MGTNNTITVYHGGTEAIKHPKADAGRPGKRPWAGYDGIEGGIANDRVIDMVEAYIAGTVSAEYALRELGKHQPNHQICILNQQAIEECLHFKESVLC